jgi:hypothetical protein
MDASPQDVLNPPEIFTKADLARAKKQAAKTFPPDKFGIEVAPLAIRILIVERRSRWRLSGFSQKSSRRSRQKVGARNDWAPATSLHGRRFA